MSEEVKPTYPIAEMFSSLQGEGVFTGTPMRFIRLAGCNVGRYETPENVPTYYPSDQLRIFQTSRSHYAVCETALAQRFICDTDYRATARLTVEEIIDGVKEHHICLTGGEPLMHNLDPLIAALIEGGKRVHLETSGTLPINRITPTSDGSGVWISCSPKKGFLRTNIPFVDEWKFVVGEDFRPEQIEEFFNYPEGRSPRIQRPVYLQPYNAITRVAGESVMRVMDVLKTHPEWRLSPQLHKYLGVR